MQLLVRADASEKIGIGHVKRCLALAEAVVRRGGRVRFACRDEGGVATDLIDAAGHSWTDVTADADAIADSEATLEIARDTGASVVLVDHYGLGVSWWLRVRDEFALAVLDDVGRAGLGAFADLVVNQNIGATADTYRGGAQLLLGPQFALLDRAYRRRDPQREAGRVSAPPHVPRIVVTVGGADPLNVTPLILRGVKGVPGGARIDVVIGPGFASTTGIEDVIAGDARMRLVGPCPSLEPILRSADLAVSAAGSTTYELACLGIPAILVQVADNQAAVAHGADTAGAARFIGRVDDLTSDNVKQSVIEVLGAPELRRQMASAGQALVDGEGADRVSAAIATVASAPRISLRDASRDDAEVLLRWRNDPVTRSMSGSTNVISRDEHYTWLEIVVSDPRRTLLLAELDSSLFGTVRFDRGSVAAEVSITVAPEFRGRGLGLPLLARAIGRFRRHAPFCAIIATISPENAASQRIFRACGFRCSATGAEPRRELETWRLEAQP